MTEKDPNKHGYWIVPPEVYEYMVRNYGLEYGRDVFVDDQADGIFHVNTRSGKIKESGFLDKALEKAFEGVPEDVVKGVEQGELERWAEELQEAAKELLPNTKPEDIFAGIDLASGSDETIEHKITVNVEALEIPKWEGGENAG